MVLVSEDRARDLPKRPVWVLGAGEAVSHHTMSEWADFTESPAVHSAKRAFDMAGVKPDEIDVLQAYDSFTVTLLQQPGETKPYAIAAVIRDDTERFQERRRLLKELAELKNPASS